MPIHNADIAEVFGDVADLLEIQGGNPFRVRAYRNAARSVGEYGQNLRTMVAQGADLKAIPAIGDDLALKIREIVTTGSCALLASLRAQVPSAITALLRVPGLGPKRVRTLYELLRVQSLEDLQRAAAAGRVRKLPGFGTRTEAHLLANLAARLDKSRRFLFVEARQRAEPLLAWLAASPGVARVEVAGSLRRLLDTVGDIDILATAREPSAVTRRFVGYEDVVEALAQGPTRASVVLRGGLQVDLRVVEPESLGAALVYFTGSKAHNVALRRLGQEHGLKINEYGVFRSDTRIAGETEESVYASVGLRWIPPELREDQGEIDAARGAALPALIARDDLRGDLHAHTVASDGRASLFDMAHAARERGLSYLAITDHSKRLAMAHGLDAARLAAQIDLNAQLTGITLLKGIEVDILEDGGLDLPDAILARLDLVVGAIHSHFDLPRERQTARILRAMDHPCFSLLAHPSGRLIESREPCDFDMLRVVRKAKERGCFLELNAQPERLDLIDTACRMAKDHGVLVSIDSDAHSVAELDNLRYGVNQARRGWLGKADVLNTRSLAKLRALLARTMRTPTRETSESQWPGSNEPCGTRVQQQPAALQIRAALGRTRYTRLESSQ
ncbi:DNA polymerase/3'-5' exonuclease PolX [Paraburkholderia oxyphila]|uniref:DNA polymerase/3'-5' exonuclease PolX n=1 Tax=Paraburkholderia oxyphila TaxID=614212 RepID=UPI0007C59DC9|nr:DNA polymerase/3'-5' exonuclease PolX [Paraburkholderia oxyphila]